MLWIGRSVRGWVWLLSFVLLLWSDPAFGQSERQRRARVVELVTESQTHYEAGRFQQAIDLLRQAYELEQSPTISYNLARAYEGLGDTEGALTAYRRYLEAAPEASDRGAIEQRIAALERQLEDKARLERERDAAAKRAAAERRRAELERKRREQQPPAQPKRSEPSIVPLVVAGLGAAVIGGGVYFGLKSRERHEQATDAELARDAANLNDEAKTFALIANISFVTGGVLLLGGASWAIVERSGSGDGAVVSFAGRF